MNEELEEELEALESIFDDEFKIIAKKPPVKIDISMTSESGKAVSLQITFPEEYPAVQPKIVVSNAEMGVEIKKICSDQIEAFVKDLIGEPVVFAVVDHVRENVDEWNDMVPKEEPVEQVEAKHAEKKEKKSKSQKRREMDRYGAGVDKPRGWNWVDVVTHLRKTKDV